VGGGVGWDRWDGEGEGGLARGGEQGRRERAGGVKYPSTLAGAPLLS
jgi:hypothetical protein